MPDDPFGEHDARTASTASGGAVVRDGWLAVVLVASFATGCGGHGRAAGTTIVFQSDRGGREALYAVRPDGRGLTKLPVEIRRDAGVSWTRDGTKALVSYDKGSGKT